MTLSQSISPLPTAVTTPTYSASATTVDPTVLTAVTSALSAVTQALEALEQILPTLTASNSTTPTTTTPVAAATTATTAAPTVSAGGPTTTSTSSMPGMTMPASQTSKGTKAKQGRKGAKSGRQQGMASMDMSGGTRNGVKDPGYFSKPMTMKMPDGKSMVEHPRTAASNPQQGQQLVNAVTRSFSNLTYAQTNPGTDPSGTHRRIPKALKQQFAKAYPGLPVPSSVVFNKPGGTPVGVLYVGSKTQKPVTPMGPAHQHIEPDGHTSNYMEHIWFTPDNLQLAYSDVMHAGKAKQAALKAGN